MILNLICISKVETIAIRKGKNLFDRLLCCLFFWSRLVLVSSEKVRGWAVNFKLMNSIRCAFWCFTVVIQLQLYSAHFKHVMRYQMHINEKSRVFRGWLNCFLVITGLMVAINLLALVLFIRFVTDSLRRYFGLINLMDDQHNIFPLWVIN